MKQEQQKKQEKERMKKEYAPAGQRSQKMLTFRCDNDLLLWLSQQANKGRYINDVIRKDMVEKENKK